MNKKEIAGNLKYALEGVDCFENCPLKDVCDLAEEDEQGTICRILDNESEDK